MTGRRFMALMVGALAVITFAFWLSTQRYLPRDRSFGTPVLDAFEADVDDVRGIRLVGAGNVTLVTLERADGRWRVVERGYAADGRRVRALLRSLGELQVLSRATRDRAEFARFGVEDVDAPDATGVRIELRSAGGPRSIVVGRDADATSGYVRVQGTDAAVLATPRIEFAHEPNAWLARTIVDVATTRVQSFDVVPRTSAPWHADRRSRGEAAFTTGAQPPVGAGNTIAAMDAATSIGVADSPAAALVALEFDDVAPAPGAEPTLAVEARATFRTFDGLVLEFSGRRDADRGWLAVRASTDPALAARFPAGAGDEAPGGEQVRAEAERIDAAARGWWYRVGTDRYDRLFGTLAPSLGPRGTP